jgi:glycosyltransferase involved in cell wall biosynthesis
MEKYIDKCLKSIISSTYKDFEIIVVNDGSTDKTEDIINIYLKKYNNITYIKQKNKGLSEARNIGVKKAKGDYILFIDSDDYIDKNLLKEINKNINENIDVLRYQLNVIYDKKVDKYFEEAFDEINGIKAFEKITKYKYIEMAQLYAINRKFYNKNKFKFTKDVYHEDYGLIPLIIANANNVKSIDFNGYNYVQREGSIMSLNDLNKTKKKMDDMLLLFDNAIKYLEKINNSEIVKSFYANSIIDKYNSLPKELQKEYISKIKELNVINYLAEDNLKRKIKKSVYKIKFGVRK